MPTRTPKPRSRSIRPTDPYAGRRERLIALAREQGVDALLVSSPTDVGYLTGFLGGDSPLVLSVTGDARPTIVSDSRYEEELEPLRDSFDIVIRTAPMLDALGGVLKATRGVVGLQAETVTIAERGGYSKVLGAKRLKDTTGLVARLREIKDAGEIALIRRAVKIQEAALLASLGEVRPGVTELELAARLEFEMKRRGSTQPSFETIVGAGATSALPHYRPGTRKLTSGRVVLIDFGASFGGYRSDMTRTFSIRSWNKELKRVYAIVLEAHERAAAALRAGVLSSEVDRAARSFIAEQGYGERFGHGLGHGIGMNVHENPRLHYMGKGTELQAGQVVTIEPGIYLPGLGGVRLEDDYVVTPKGAEKLGSLPKDLDWATLG
ncbi:MAG: Xaa-Pro peptidase family protein [Planctomycetota bacterium]|nr:Xaa-Pro peptidase family protein [Planctomycetota bacterium]